MPFPILPALALAQTGFQAYQGYKQGKKADELARRGPADITPLAYKQMLAGQANQANNAQIAGYGQAIDNINEQQATSLGEAKRAGVSSSNLLNVLTRLNQQGSREKRNLAMAGAQAQERRLADYNRGLLGKAQFDEQARQEQQQAIGALRGAKMQNYYNAFTSGIGALGYGLEGMKGQPDIPDAPDTIETMTPSYTPSNVEIPQGRPSMIQGASLDKYQYQPQPYGTYTPSVYQDLMARKRYTGDTFR